MGGDNELAVIQLWICVGRPKLCSLSLIIKNRTTRPGLCSSPTQAEGCLLQSSVLLQPWVLSLRPLLEVWKRVAQMAKQPARWQVGVWLWIRGLSVFLRASSLCHPYGQSCPRPRWSQASHPLPVLGAGVRSAVRPPLSWYQSAAAALCRCVPCWRASSKGRRYLKPVRKLGMFVRRTPEWQPGKVSAAALHHVACSNAATFLIWNCLDWKLSSRWSVLRIHTFLWELLWMQWTPLIMSQYLPHSVQS